MTADLIGGYLNIRVSRFGFPFLLFTISFYISFVNSIKDFWINIFYLVSSNTKLLFLLLAKKNDCDKMNVKR